MNPLMRFLDDRLGLVRAWASFSDRPVAGGPSARHVFAPLMLYLFLQQAVLGVALATYYSPSSTDAWASTAYIQDQVTMGWLVRGLHYHGASAMVVLAAVWMTILAFTRAYRRPWELSWIAVVALCIVSLGFGLSGNALPWDQAGFWGIQVELGVAEETPGGEILRRLIQGGSDAGNLTLLRLYAIHVFVLPLAFLALIGIVFKQRKLHGDVPMSSDVASCAYFPSQMFVDMVAIAALQVVLVGLALQTHGAELMGPADPTENFQARPEWYFLFLYKLRMMMGGPLEFVATMVLPGLVVGFLVAVPFLSTFTGASADRIVRVGVGLVIVGVAVLTGVAIIADKKNEEYQEALAAAEKTAAQARKYALEGVVPLGGPAVFFNDPDYQTRQLYKEHCQSCHMVDGVGGDEAPDLSDYSSRAWLKALIRNPDAPRFFGATDFKGEMETYPEDDLPEDQLDAVVEYLVDLMGDPSMTVDEALAKKGKTLWDDELDCNACHEVEEGVDNDGPNLLHHGSEAWVARVIRDSSQADLFGEKAQMPKFGDKLSDEEIATLAKFVTGQRAKEDDEAEEETVESKD